jgi:sugar lactone lactonase YvrE
MLAEIAADDPSVRLNDGSCDAAGRLFAGTMAFSGAAGAGALYRLDPSLGLEVAVAPVTVSNGIDWSPDAARMYYIDSASGGIDVFDYDLASGMPTKRRRLVSLGKGDGIPDGLTVDMEGHVWVAFWGGWCVRRYDPEGLLDRVVRLPTAAVTACSFGGPGLTDLYVTTASEGLTTAEREEQPLAGALFRVSTEVQGRAGLAFGG